MHYLQSLMLHAILLSLFLITTAEAAEPKTAEPPHSTPSVETVPTVKPTQTVDDQIKRDFGLDHTTPAPTQIQHSVPSRGGAVMKVYRGEPIALSLAVGLERRIQFERDVEIGMDPGMDKQLSVEIYANNMLLTAHEPFEARVQVRDLVTRKIVPIDISAYHDLSAQLIRPVQLYTDAPRPAILTAPAQTAPKSESLIARLPSRLLTPRSAIPIDKVAMTRFAAQQYYAPTRLIAPITGAKTVPVQQKPLRLYRGDVVTTTPNAAWQIGGLFVTAVRVENKTRDTQVLDPRKLIGRWQAATFHHTVLQPKGGDDRTMVYLISSLPMDEAIMPYARLKGGVGL